MGADVSLVGWARCAKNKKFKPGKQDIFPSEKTKQVANEPDALIALFPGVFPSLAHAKQDSNFFL